ncbi:trypsin-like peptidase domain-containing protein [Clostridium algoriphilum]|uniref:S1C family serine protease n=1 Tax=Clostridium algoriphilum TaxID=198347 RepID=UPI001CF1C505|nr:trypsin-like peptidase domain-containing protein [Clostridium algoriphilum]MCB2293218.1 trypsin-like peptidase domain-containing protein [Clostridium algoriphilum]
MDEDSNGTNTTNGNIDESNDSIGKDNNEGNGNTMINQSNDEYKEKPNQTKDFILESDNYNNKNNKEVKKNKGGMRKRILSYIFIGVICSTLGGIGSAIVTIKIMNNMSTTAVPKVASTKISNNTSSNIINTKSTQDLSVPEIVKKVSSSVVAISTKSSSESSDFSGKTSEQEGVGTGIIFNVSGYILTNYHVISGAQNVKVTLSNGKEVSAKVINYDAAADVAVIKLPDGTKVPGVAEFGDSDMLQVGESVVAIGNPLGKEFLGSVTTGVVSAVNRQISIENKNLKFIQTDAAINPGNSGGPLVNSKGQVIGINTAKIGQEGVEGLGFSIPINTVNPKMDALIKPILNIGISCRNITQDISKEYNIPVGVYISQIQDFSAAEKSGIRSADIITKFDGKKIKTVEEINKIKATHKAGDVIKIELVRSGKTIKINLTLSI